MARALSSPAGKARGWLALAGLLLGVGTLRAETIKVGIEADSAPISFVSGQGHVSGFAVDVVTAVAHDQGFDVEFEVMPWKDILTQLRNGRLDMVANISYAPERTTFADFSVPYLTLPAGVFYNRGMANPPLNLHQLVGQRLGSGRQSVTDSYLRRNGAKNITYFESLLEDLRAINRGEIDATIALGPVARRLAEDMNLPNVAEADFALGDLQFESHMAVPAGRTILLYRLNTGLAHIRTDGSYDRAYERWIGPLQPREVHWRDIQFWLFCVLAVIAVLLCAFLWQRQVSARLLIQAEDLRRIQGELRESQDLLNRSAQLLQQTQSAARIGGWELETATGRLFWTEESYRLHEADPATFQPTFENLLAFYSPESRPILQTALEATFANGAPCDLEVQLVTRSQRKLSVHITGRSERNAQGEVVRSYGSFHDITASKRSAEERDRLQQKMLETQKLESLGVLAGGIAHDFNNILTVILSNADLGRMLTQERPDIDEHLQQIADASMRAAELCQRMLAYAGKGKLILEQVDLSALVQDSSKLLEHLVSKKAVLQFDVAKHLPGVDADAAQIHQVLLNLTVNASEALEGREGIVRVSTGTTLLDAGEIAALAPNSEAPEGLFVYLKVQDNGCGMSPETLAKIFDPFYTTKFTGRGLGLAAVHGICRGHRGVLRVESSLGGGTVFQLYLPALDHAPAVVAKPERATGAARPASGQPILLAEDEPTVRKAMTALLQRAGFVPVPARDGREALELFRAAPDRFAAVVLDLTMPRLDGAEALQEMRRIRPGLKALVMSGFGEEETLAKLRDAGRAVFLHKPFTPDEFADKLADAMA